MKKFVLTVVAMMTMTLGFAESENHRTVKNAESYDMTFDMRRLAVTLDLTFDQMETIQVIQDNFNEAMLEAAAVPGPQSRMLVHQAVRKDVHQMRYVLNDKQYNTYLLLLGTTLRNRGL